MILTQCNSTEQLLLLRTRQTPPTTTPTTMRVRGSGFVALLVFSGLFASSAFGGWRKTNKLKRECYEEAMGTVISVEKRQEEKRSQFNSLVENVTYIKFSFRAIHIDHHRPSGSGSKRDGKIDHAREQNENSPDGNTQPSRIKTREWRWKFSDRSGDPINNVMDQIIKEPNRWILNADHLQVGDTVELVYNPDSLTDEELQNIVGSPADEEFQSCSGWCKAICFLRNKENCVEYNDVHIRGDRDGFPISLRSFIGPSRRNFPDHDDPSICCRWYYHHMLAVFSLLFLILALMVRF